MPYKCEKIKLNEYDRRRKLSEEDKNNIIKEYESGLFSQRMLANKYNVSKSLIAIIVNPERAAKVKQRVKEHWKEYSDRASLTKATAKKDVISKNYIWREKYVNRSAKKFFNKKYYS